MIKILMNLKLFLIFSIFQITLFSPLFPSPDLTIIGYVIPEDGLGKIPITILETLGSEISANIRNTRGNPRDYELPPCVNAALNNSDQTAGKVALSTVGLWHAGGHNVVNIPTESIVKIAYSMFETTRIPSMWVKILNEEFDAVVVPDAYLNRVYEDCGVKIPIFVLPIPMLLDPFFAYPPHSNIPSTPFVFGDASANKNPAVLLEGFAKAFGNNPSVKLIMRSCIIRDETRESTKRLIADLGLTNVILEEGCIPLGTFIERLASFDCYVNLSRGEGFSLIPREALALGLPVIISNNTASTTICDSGFVRAVPSSIKVPPLPVYQFLFDQECGEQFDCNPEDVAVALLDVYEHYEKYIKRAHDGRKWVNRFNSENHELRSLYLTLVKPKIILLGSNNVIKDGVIITNCSKLYQKYLSLIHEY